VSRAWLGAALVAALAVAYYGGSLENGFVWDDRLTAAAPADLTTILTHRTGSYYRPVVMLSFAADRFLWGTWPAGYHLTNITCHVVVAWLLLYLARAVGLGAGTALAAALIFVGHPVQTEAVTYVSGRTDPLCALFVLLSLHAWRRSRHAVDRFALMSGLAALLALLCKEAAVAMPLVMLVRGAHPAKRPPPPLVPILCAFLWLTLWAVSGGPGLQVSGILERLPAIGVAALTYLRLLSWPSDLHLERFVPVAGWSTATAAGLWAALAGGAAALYKVAAHRHVPGGRLWLAIGAAAYAPVSGLVPIYPAIADRSLFMPEHFLYLPLLGLAPLATGLGASLLERRWTLKAASLLLGAILLVWGVVVVDRNRDYLNEETLFTQTLRYEPPAARVWFNLANLRLAEGKLDEAAELFQAALAREPEDAAAHLNLGITFQRSGRLAEAERQYERAIVLDPGRSEAYRGLATLLARRGERAAARELWEQAERTERHPVFGGGRRLGPTLGQGQGRLDRRRVIK
jgi:hypothetical protein